MKRLGKVLVLIIWVSLFSIFVTNDSLAQCVQCEAYNGGYRCAASKNGGKYCSPTATSCTISGYCQVIGPSGSGGVIIEQRLAQINPINLVTDTNTLLEIAKLSPRFALTIERLEKIEGGVENY